MLKSAVKHYVKKKFLTADININGNQPWDIQVYNDEFFSRVLLHKSIGLGESYMDGWINSLRLDESIQRILQSGLGNNKVRLSPKMTQLFSPLILNKQTRRKALVVGKKHYDIGNDLFQKMLDKRMVYSCAYWKEAKNLDQAQEAKLDLVCKKIGLKPGMKVLDIGCGWGGFSKFAAEKYGAHVVGITISKEQLEYAKEICKGLPVELRFQDYRDVNDTFDRVVSIGQMEHVGHKNYRKYMRIVHNILKEDGMFLLHTIGSNLTSCGTDAWTEKYIFPNSKLPSVMQLAQASEGFFVMEDWHNFGTDYDKTLMAWFDNFDRHWPELKSKYDERFYRMWKYYLLSCAGAFRARAIQLWQIVYSKHGVPGGYQSIR